MEDALQEAQKMEAIGKLTGGVAHDFNNLLTAVIGSAEALADALADQPALLDILDVTLDAANRGAELVRQLLTLSRNQPLEPSTIDCLGFLAALKPMLSRTIGQSILVSIEDNGVSLCCRADRNQLTSAILNLAINARDAMPDGGTLTLRVEPAAGQAVFVVRDTGEGMNEQTRARALEPFFTTKPVGAGSGLGLAMVHGFASQSGGAIEIESVVGSGTEIHLSLPAANCAESQVAAGDGAAPLASAPRVMLVEDDNLVRGQVRRQLEALGCQVVDFADPYDAIDMLAGEASIDMLMTDISMPGGMNGRQLADHARLFRPDMPVLFTSGHTDDPIARGSAVGAFLPKPYRRAELARKIGEVLGEPA
jgi:CheY-like chemotaxis protein